MSKIDTKSQLSVIEIVTLIPVGAFQTQSLRELQRGWLGGKFSGRGEEAQKAEIGTNNNHEHRD